MARNARCLAHRVKPHAGATQQIGQCVLVLQRLAKQPLCIGRRQRGRADPGGAQALFFPGQPLALLAKGGPATVLHQTQFTSCFGQAQVGVVFTQLQTVLSPAGEHSVGLRHAFVHQVIHQHTQIGLVASR